MRDLVRIVMAVSGVVLALVGAALAVLWLAWPLLHQGPNAFLANTLVAGGAALGLLYGMILFIQAFRGRDAPAPLPPPGIPLFLWLGVLILGAYTLTTAPTDPTAGWVFPILHVLAVGLPIAAVLAFAGRRVDLSGGTIGLQFVYGGTLAVLLSLVVQLGALLILGSLIAAIAPGGINLGQVVLALLSGDGGLLRSALQSGPLVALGFVALLTVAPIVEEAAKALAVPLWAGWQPTRPRALVWGLATGLGFALSEGMFSTLAAAAAGNWTPAVLFRAATAVIHGMATALVGLGWYSSYTRHRPLSLAVGYVAAVVVHGFWNAAFLAGALVHEEPLGSTTTPQGVAVDIMAADLLRLGAAVVLVILFVILIRTTARPRWTELRGG